MMDDEYQKRNTDCVYFLASPLTCKKGLECEFRHSEMARLNPRDCWYWLAGNCLNPTCSYRHPPLEGRPDNSLEPAPLPHPSTLSKSNVPCYFHFNGFCNKGENCSFLHGPSNATSGQFSRAASTVTNPSLLEDKAVANNEGTPALVQPTNPQLEATTKTGEPKQLPSKVGRHPSASNILQQHLSPQDSAPECDERIVKSEILLPAENLQSPLVLDHSTASADQSSDDQYDRHREPEDRGESSPGFDVLVDDGSENMCYEDDPEYLLAHQGDDRVLHEQLLSYDYEEPVYDPLEYGESGVMYEHGIYGSYHHPDDDHVSDHVRRVSKRSRDMMLSPLALQKRQHFSREVDNNDRDDADLRNHLRKRRRRTGRSKRTVLSHVNVRGQERCGRRHSRQPLEGRLASAVGTDIVGVTENDSRWQECSRQLQPRYSRSRQQDRDRRRQARSGFILSEISRSNSAPRDDRPAQVSSTAFTGPKTLAQIKEEKRKARENGNSFRSTSRNGRAAAQNFEGPKPLSEILKDKRRFGSTSDDNSSSRSRHDHSEYEMNHIGFHVDNADNLAEYEEEDDESLAV